jgi:hypothetical protein
MSELPAAACWRHEGLRSGFEVASFTPQPDGLRIEGTTVGLQDGLAWVVSYEISLNHGWRTRAALVSTRTPSRLIDRTIHADGSGHWLVDGHEADHLNGCIDIDLESSAMTNALPVHRLGLLQGQHAEAPAAYVGLPDTDVQRLEQSYTRVANHDDGHPRYDYHAPAFDFRTQLVYDDAGLLLEYPGIGVRVGQDSR